MKVFNLYKKIFRRYISVILMYVVIFLVISVSMSTSSESNNNMFSEVRVNVYLENLDEGSALSEGLVNYLNKYVNYVDVEEKSISDALFFREIYSFITIPENFESDYLNGINPSIVQERIEENVTSIAIDRAINKYLNYVRVYLNQTDKELSEVIVLVNEVLDNETEAITLTEESDQLISSSYYYKTLSYIIIAIILTVVGIITISFRKFDVRRRLIVSPYSLKKSNLEMIFGNLLFTIFLVIIFSVVSLFLYPDALKSINGLLLTINTLVFALAALSMSYFMSLLINNEQVLSGVNNVLSLGTSFITGAFVPQALLGSGILIFAHIFPNYYYVYNVDMITSTSKLSSDNIMSIVLYFGIQLLFAGVFLLLTTIVSKKQARSES